MLSPDMYWLAFALAAVLCGTAAQFGASRDSALRLLLAWIGPAILLAALGYLDWSAETVKETPLGTYLVSAILTPLVAVATAWLLRRRARRSIQWSAAVAASFFTELGVLVATFFF